MITNIMSKIDMDKLSNIKVKEINILYDKKKTGVLKINVSYNPPDIRFADNFIEILKLVISASDETKVNFKEV